MSSFKFNAQQHLAKANRNEAFAGEVSTLNPDYHDWQVIAAFYAAVHVIQAYFTKKTRHYPQNHQERDTLVLNEMAMIYNEYRELKQLSVSCRYLCWPTNQKDVDDALDYLQKIRAYVTARL